MAEPRQIEVRLDANEALAVVAGKSGMVQHGAVAYDPQTDELVLTISPASVLRLRPARAFAEALSGVMMQAAEAGSGLPPVLPCPACGEETISALVGVATHATLLDAKPSPSGVYLLTRPGRARTLRPMEHPIGLTYRRHRCSALAATQAGGKR
jgi:hypothetical protein